LKKDQILLKRLYGIIDSADELSSEDDEKLRETPVNNMMSPIENPNVVDISDVNKNNLSMGSREIANLPLPRHIKSPMSASNLKAVAPISSKSNQSDSKMKKQKTIQMPERALKNKCIRIFFVVSTHNAFNIGLTFCIVLNTALLAMDRYPIKNSQQNMLETMNGLLSWVFFIEMVTKLIGLGIKDYAADSFNLFDCTVVVISIVDLVISKVGMDFNGGGAISALRAVRLLRVFKLARSWTSFRLLLEKMIITLKDIRNFSVLMLLFMFIYTLLGMELYAYKVIFNNEDLESVAEEPGEYPRANFNTFLSGFTTIFIVLIGEDWNTQMYNHVRTRGYGAIFFFVSLFIMGNLVLLNLFLAILLKNFEEPPGKEEEEEDEVEGFIVKLKATFAKLKTCCLCCKKK
jgi:hypothetical protein